MAAAAAAASSTPNLKEAARSCFLTDSDYERVGAPEIAALQGAWTVVFSETKKLKQPFHLKLSNPLSTVFVCFGAALVRATEHLRVAFLSPTVYYLDQAKQSARVYLHHKDEKGQPVAGSSPRFVQQLALQFVSTQQPEIWSKYDVVLMHGDEFFSPPADWSGTCIVLSVPGCPSYTRPVRACSCGDC
jgi:hypothetical protein